MRPFFFSLVQDDNCVYLDIIIDEWILISNI